jgi:hypothetical protein
MVRQLRDELRCLLIDRFGTELRVALQNIASEELLERLEAAETPDVFSLDATISLRALRFLRELLHEIEEERATWR